MLTIETQPAHTPSRHGNCPILRPMRPDFFQTSSPESADPAAQIRAGISRPQAQISPWYFYDQVGSSLFDVITVLPDYYPTRTEAAIIDEHLPAMAEATGLDGCSIIDLGAGTLTFYLNGVKHGPGWTGIVGPVKRCVEIYYEGDSVTLVRTKPAFQD